MAVRSKLTKKQQAELEWAKKVCSLLAEPYEMAARRQRTYRDLAAALAHAYCEAVKIIHAQVMDDA